MKSSLLVYILIFLLFLASTGFVLQSCENKRMDRESQNTKRLLMRGQKQTQRRIDSMNVEYEKIQAMSQALMYEVERSREELKKQHAVTTQWKVKYEKAKNIPVPDWSHASLDSIMDAIVISR